MQVVCALVVGAATEQTSVGDGPAAQPHGGILVAQFGESVGQWIDIFQAPHGGEHI